MFSLCTFSIVTVFGILAIYWVFGEGKGRAYTAEKLIPLMAFPYSLRQHLLHSVWDESRERKLGGTGRGGERGTVRDQEYKEKKGK